MCKQIIVDSGIPSDFLLGPVPQRSTFAGPAFLLTTAGQALAEIDGHAYTLQADTLLALLPSHLIHITLEDKAYNGLTLAFLFDSMTDFPYMFQSCLSEKMERTPVIRLTTEETARLAKLHEAISTHHCLTAHPSYLQILRSLLFIFTAEVSAIYSTKPLKSSATHDEEITDGFFRLLHTSFRTNRETAFYADRLCLSAKHLSRVIGQVTGHVPAYWITDFIVREAKMLLKSTTLTITQLSEQLNFANSSFFARYFKRHTGMSPLEFRAKPES